MELKDIYKWIREYTWGIKIENIEWIVLGTDELQKFFDDNYLDYDSWNYATDDIVEHKPVGMHYLPFSRQSVNMKHLLGICDNSTGKKTIIACITYVEDYRLFSDQKHPLTYLITAEVNKYFRQRGLSKVMFNEFCKVINPEQHLLSTPESDMGSECHVFKTLKQCLNENGFSKSATLDNHSDYIYSQEYHDIICENEMQLKMK